MTVPPFRTGRQIQGISACLLPFNHDSTPDWTAFRTLLNDTWRAGLTPAVNMDTGYVNLIDRRTRQRVLAETRAVCDTRAFVAGAFIEGDTGNPITLYRQAVREIRSHGGTPILFQTSALATASESEVLEAYRHVDEDGGPLLAFELGTMFAPFGRIYSTDFIARLFEIEAFVGVKHSSLDRACEWERLALRDRLRPDFRIYTGNDLAIDMVFYGSDYLLGLSAFHVEAFAARDRLWAANDSRALGLNDLLQYLGHLTFRPPVPAYKHSAAQFLHLRGRIATNLPHPQGARRPGSDEPILADIRDRIDKALEALRP